ncbi:MAG TPA: hypothetical protein VFB54_19530 [Burkholderiales bacterium]|nr:hypothetical protein [Burkholderiales bacterium]
MPVPQRRVLDGELVVRDRSSGATHLLSQVSGTILVLLIESESSMRAADIAHVLGVTAPTDEPVTLSEIDRILLELERIGLVARVPA